MSDRLYRLLFVLALVICPFILFLHQLDIEHHADPKECRICLASQGHDHALALGIQIAINEATI
jgi:hypothetical protein